MRRDKLRGLKRNAAVVLGNVGTTDDVDLLTRALDGDDPLVRAHAAWALGKIASPAAVEALRARSAERSDANVSAELRRALEGTCG